MSADVPPDQGVDVTPEGDPSVPVQEGGLDAEQAAELRYMMEQATMVEPIIRKLEKYYDGTFKHPMKLDPDEARVLFAFIMNQQGMNEALQMQYAVMAGRADELQEELDALQTRKLWRPGKK